MLPLGTAFASAAILLSTLNLQLSTFAQGTAFTYQGVLNDQGAPANGTYDLQFNLFTLPAGGAPIGPLLTTNDLAISNGLFVVTLDFGASVFTGAPRWLEIRVRPGASAVFTNVEPRQALLPAPYAIYSGRMNAAGLIGTIAASNIADGTITAPKIAPGALSSLDAPDGSPLRALSVNTNGAVGVGTNTSGAALQVAGGGTNLFSAANPRLLSVITNNSTARCR